MKLICGDCLEIMKTLPDKSVDAVITDPPYGIGMEYSTYKDSWENWISLMDAVFPEMIRLSRGPVFIPTSKIEGEVYFYRKTPTWRICWNKGAGTSRSPIGFKDWETIFVFGGKPYKQMHDHFSTPITLPPGLAELHPCPKPEIWALWLINRACPIGAIVLDPFMGSGTTGVVCIETGRDFIGIEIDPSYFAIAERRIKEAQAQLKINFEEA